MERITINAGALASALKRAAAGQFTEALEQHGWTPEEVSAFQAIAIIGLETLTRAKQHQRPTYTPTTERWS